MSMQFPPYEWCFIRHILTDHGTSGRLDSNVYRADRSIRKCVSVFAEVWLFSTALYIRERILNGPSKSKLLHFTVSNLYRVHEETDALICYDSVLKSSCKTFMLNRSSSDWQSKFIAIDNNHHGNGCKHRDRNDSFEIAKYQNNHGLQTELEKGRCSL